MIATTLAVLAPLLTSAHPLPQEEERTPVSGRVKAAYSGKVLSGVRVQALRDGVFQVDQAVTDDEGNFVLHLEFGDYDLRAIPDDRAYTAGFHRDLEVSAKHALVADVQVPEVERVLARLGIPLDDLLDTDRDFCPDAMEPEARTNKDNADSNDDGISDGVSVWVGADPRRGPARSDGQPVIQWPHEGQEVVVTPGFRSPPLGLLFAHVYGATGYQLEVHGSGREPLLVTELDFERGDLLVGEGCAMRWAPSSTWEEGELRLTLQGYYGSPEEPVGKPFVRKVRIVHAVGLEPVLLGAEPDEEHLSERQKERKRERDREKRKDRDPERWKGVVAGTTIHLYPGERVVVPRGERLELIATGSIVVDQDASITGEAGDEDDPPGVVVVRAGGDVVVLGELASGDGGRGLDVVAQGRSPQDPAVEAAAGHGGPGGNLMVFAHGELVVDREGVLRSGDGGEGGHATAAGLIGGEALAFGGNGGAGGTLVVDALDLAVADRPGRLLVGRGGKGGDAEATGGDGDVDVQAGLPTALPGVGGDAGDVFLRRWDLRRDYFVHLADESYPLQGGIAGEPGVGRQIAGKPGWPGRDVAVPGKPHTVLATLAGGRGWMNAGAGQPAEARGGEGFLSGEGGAATAQGGPGGHVSRIGISSRVLQLAFGFVAQGGRGGDATAHGGPGGSPSGSRRPGAGGGAVAIGGIGGFGHVFEGALLTGGGDGGDAAAVGHAGKTGLDDCPRYGQEGSAGGPSEAIGGAGGDANFRGGNAGGSTATGGAGGGGGRGSARGGSGGVARARPSEGGDAFLYDGEAGFAARARGARGPQGASCPD